MQARQTPVIMACRDSSVMTTFIILLLALSASFRSEALPLYYPESTNDKTKSTVDKNQNSAAKKEEPVDPLGLTDPLSFFSFSAKNRQPLNATDNRDNSNRDDNQNEEPTDTKTELDNKDKKKRGETFDSLRTKPIAGVSFNGWDSSQLINDLATSSAKIRGYKLNNKSQLLDSREVLNNRQANSNRAMAAPNVLDENNLQAISVSSSEIQLSMQTNQQASLPSGPANPIDNDEFSSLAINSNTFQNVVHKSSGFGKIDYDDFGLLATESIVEERPGRSMSQSQSGMGKFLSTLIGDYLSQWWFWLVIGLLILLIDLARIKR